MSRYAILIDGGFAKRKIGTQQHPANADSFKSLVEKIKEKMQGQTLHRVYYYDALPFDDKKENPLSKEKIDFSRTPVVQNANKLFADLAKLPFFSLRLGVCAFGGWEVQKRLLKGGEEITINADGLSPNIQQKGVDMRIDIASLTLKKHVQTIVLVSADSDFVPALKFSRREGANVFLVTFGQRVKPEMLEHSDMLLEIN